MNIKSIYQNPIVSNVETRAKFIWLVVFSIAVSIVEVVGVSAVMPFVDIATNFDRIHSNQYYQWLFIFLNFEKEVDFAIFIGLLLIVFYIFRGIVNLVYGYVMAKFSASLYKEAAKNLFDSYLNMSYGAFTYKNSSYLTKSIITESVLISDVIHAALLIVSEVFVLIFLYALMLITSWKITIVFTLILIVKLLLITRFISERIKKIGIKRERIQSTSYEIINRTFGDFKNIKLQAKDILKNTKKGFFVVTDKYAATNLMHTFLTSLPRVLLETGGFLLVMVLLLVLLHYEQSNVSFILPTISLFVLALYRLLPSVNRIVNSYNLILYHHKSIDIVSSGLSVSQENFGDKSISFSSKIELIDIGFSYKNQVVLSDVHLKVCKGEKIAIIGDSGSGKSTLVDLIIGIRKPSCGRVVIDNTTLDLTNMQSWRAQIGYISQDVYLFDGTVLENVCFGRKLDKQLLDKVLKQANILDFLESKDGVHTLVGEGGMQLSGGQKQRIAIARALYGNPKILVLDEATSALDSDTEEKIMNEIYKASQDKTLIIIAHRLSTVKSCDKIYQVDVGKIKAC